jgi:hypothetical protein
VRALWQYAIFAQPFNQGRIPCGRVVEYFASSLAFYQQGNVQLALANINSNDLHRVLLFTLPLSHSLRASLFTQAQASDTVRTLSASRWRGLYLRIRLVALGMTQPSRYRFSRASPEILSNIPVGRIGNDGKNYKVGIMNYEKINNLNCQLGYLIVRADSLVRCLQTLRRRTSCCAGRP